MFKVTVIDQNFEPVEVENPKTIYIRLTGGQKIVLDIQDEALETTNFHQVIGLEASEEIVIRPAA